MFVHRAFWITAALIAVVSSVTARASEWKAKIGNLPISIQQIAPAAEQATPPEIITETVVVRESPSIDPLLRVRGIKPNADAYSLVYELNPTLTAVDKMRPGRKLVLPRIQNKPRSAQFVIKVDPELRLRVSSCREHLSQTMDQAANLGPSNFQSEEAHTEVESALTEINVSMSDFSVVARDNDRLLSETILLQLVGECEYVRSIFESQPSVITNDQRDRIVQIQKDMNLKRANLNEKRGPNELPGRWLDTTISVNTTHDHTVIPYLRVCWVPEGLLGVPGEEHPMARVSSPAEDVLPEADYYFWAAKDDPLSNRQCANRVSAPLWVSVRKNATGTKNEVNIQVGVSH